MASSWPWSVLCLFFCFLLWECVKKGDGTPGDAARRRTWFGWSEAAEMKVFRAIASSATATTELAEGVGSRSAMVKPIKKIAASEYHHYLLLFECTMCWGKRRRVGGQVVWLAPTRPLISSPTINLSALPSPATCASLLSYKRTKEDDKECVLANASTY